MTAHWFSIRLHHWAASDDHRAFHDHPWWFITLVLQGGYTDVSHAPEGSGFSRIWERMTPGRIRFRSAIHRHTVEVDPGGCWTLMLTGPVCRRWGFWPGGRFMKTNKYFLTYGHHPCRDIPISSIERENHGTTDETPDQFPGSSGTSHWR